MQKFSNDILNEIELITKGNNNPKNILNKINVLLNVFDRWEDELINREKILLKCNSIENNDNTLKEQQKNDYFENSEKIRNHREENLIEEKLIEISNKEKELELKKNKVVEMWNQVIQKAENLKNLEKIAEEKQKNLNEKSKQYEEKLREINSKNQDFQNFNRQKLMLTEKEMELEKRKKDLDERDREFLEKTNQVYEKIKFLNHEIKETVVLPKSFPNSYLEISDSKDLLNLIKNTQDSFQQYQNHKILEENFESNDFNEQKNNYEENKIPILQKSFEMDINKKEEIYERNKINRVDANINNLFPEVNKENFDHDSDSIKELVSRKKKLLDELTFENEKKFELTDKLNNLLSY